MMLFLFDQIFHLGVLVGVYFQLSGSFDLPPFIDWTAVGICALAYLVVLKPTAVFIQIFSVDLPTPPTKRACRSPAPTSAIWSGS